MPDITIDNELKKLVSSSPHLSNTNLQKKEQECDEYLKTRNKNIHDISPLAVHFIISKLPQEEQINFFKENIDYIKENDEEIFLYNYLNPHSLSYYISLKVLKEIKKIDKELIEKIINKSNEHIFHDYKHEDYIEFYNYFYDEITKTKNRTFINNLYLHNRCFYDTRIDLNDIYNTIQTQDKYNKEFIEMIIKKYENKISTFDSEELLDFIYHIDDIKLFKDFIKNNYQRLNTAFKEITEEKINSILSETNYQKQTILIENFYENIIEKQDINKIFLKLSPNVILDLYNKDKDIFKNIELKDWIELCSEDKCFNEKFKKILDTFEIIEIESLFNKNNHLKYKYYYGTNALKYIETKYRNNIKINGLIEEIDENTSIFSYKYLKNLKEIKSKFKDNTITKNSSIYKKHLSIFIIYLKSNNIINNIEENNLKAIDQLFYRITMKDSITILLKISNIEEIALINRIGKITFEPKSFTIEQIEKYNIKHHKQLYNKIDLPSSISKTLILKLIFITGFTNAKKIIELDNETTTLEHLVGNINMKNIKLDEQGNPILNSKIINLLFSDNYSKIKEMLLNKESELYTHFPRIFNEWEIIKMYNKDKNLKEILDFLQSDNIKLIPKHYRLEGLFKYIGSSGHIVNETLLLHDKIINRKKSTIPRIKGTKDEYTYEILRLDNMESLCIGNQTNCCFTVLGTGYPCLKHATTNQNGRVLVIKKNNQILSHSWIWRNGNTLCLDNIELAKSIQQVDFFHIYLEIFKEIINKSYQKEGLEECIKNITIGFTNFDKPIMGIENYPCLISKNCDLGETYDEKLGPNRQIIDNLPQPKYYQKYSDSKNVQYLIVGNGDFQSYEPNVNYQDEREEVLYYSKDEEYNKEYINEMNKKINALRYIQQEQTNTINDFKIIDVEDLSKAYCTTDWYIIYYKDGLKEQFHLNTDDRAHEEIEQTQSIKQKKLIKQK